MEDLEKRKITELLKEMRSSADEVKSTSQEGGLKWMYKGPSDLIDREEYLLGKAIDKTFEELNSGGSTDLVGRTGEQSNVPKRLLEKTDNTEQVDIAKKMLEDPLYAIKQKEMEARKKLLNNPVKLKQIKQLFLERSRQNNAHRKEKKKKLKKNSEEHLNLLIIKKLKKFSDKEKRKALNKIMKSESKSSWSSSSSSSSSSGDYRKKHKLSRKRSSSSDSTDSSSESSGSEDNKKNVKLKKKRKKEIEKEKRRSSSSSSSSSSDSSDREAEKNKNNRKHKKRRKSNNYEKESSVDSNSKRGRKPKHDRRNLENKRMSRERDGRGKGKPSRRDVSEGSKRKIYGLMMPDGKKPDMKRSPARKYEKRVETKTKYVAPPKSKPMSEKEREETLKEMMKDAKLRKEEREKNLASHRKKELQEEESKTYDDDFMRRQMKHLTSQGTMAERIKSNINNIQRSKSSMDSNFMRK